MPERTRVLIVDDHALIRRGTRQILEQDDTVEVVGEASDGAEAVRLVAETVPDVVLMDIGMPTMNGVAATKLIAADWPQVRIVVLTIHDDDEYVWEAIQAGASGYLLKDVDDDQLISAVHTVVAGGAVLDPGATAIVMGRVRGTYAGDDDEGREDLTDRELEVLRLAADGCGNRTIGDMLDLSPRTVETHMHRVFRKLGVQSRTEAVVVAVRRGLIELGEGP